jgi:hypothetical protein
MQSPSLMKGMEMCGYFQCIMLNFHVETQQWYSSHHNPISQHLLYYNVGNYFIVNDQMYGLVMCAYMLFHMKYEGK